MAVRTTEAVHPDAIGMDTLPGAEALRRLLDGQKAALDAITPALPLLAEAADLMADTVRGGGSLVYAAAGSSGLMAISDGLELPATFGIDPSRILLLMAGGLPTRDGMPGATEDDAETAAKDAATIQPGDCVIAVAASGSTPYTCALVRAARARGAKVIGIANNTDAPLFSDSDIAIALETPPELVAGSTRMGAGTAQKAALNMMSTLMGLRLGHVHDGMMVNMRIENRKLRQRALGMVERIAGTDPQAAEAALDHADGSIKSAILLASGARDRAQAETLLAAANGTLRGALETLGASGPG